MEIGLYGDFSELWPCHYRTDRQLRQHSSTYFVNATSPGSMSVAGYEGYAETMVQAFAPQLMVPGIASKSIGADRWSR